MKYFSKEKDTFLKVVNAILIVGAIFAVIIFVATGIQILNRQKVLLDTERKKTCTTYYLEYKKEQENLTKSNNNNFFISLGSLVVLSVALHLLNKKI